MATEFHLVNLTEGMLKRTFEEIAPKYLEIEAWRILIGNCAHQLTLKMISNRGTKVYPTIGAITDGVDHWRCRCILRSAGGELTDDPLLVLLHRVAGKHRWMHVEKLQELDGLSGFTKA